MIMNLFFDVVGYSDFFNSLDNNTFVKITIIHLVRFIMLQTKSTKHKSETLSIKCLYFFVDFEHMVTSFSWQF